MLGFSHFYRLNTLILGQFPCFSGIFHIKPFDRPIFLNYPENLHPNYVRLEKKDAANIFLKIDFDMYLLLSEAERGVPVLFLESDLVKKVWRFIEQLQSFNGIEEDIVNINLLDIQNKKRIDVMIDREDKKYLSVNSSRTEEA